MFLLLSPAGAASPPADIPWGQEIRFSRACESGRKVTIAAVGDVLLQRGLQIQAMNHRDRFASLWKGVEDLISRTDLTYANFEGVAAPGVDKSFRAVPDPGFVFDDSVYSGLPRVNVHPFSAVDLAASGVDVVSTANNHALDRGPLGVERTIETLKEAGLRFTGTRARDDKQSNWYTITWTKGMRIAWLACTFGTNDQMDEHRQVLHCFRDEEQVVRTVRTLVNKEHVDAVIVTPHWRTQNVHEPLAVNARLARRFVEAGALAVLAAHPHFIQPWEKIITSDGRETFVIYSLGNFISNQERSGARASIVLSLGLTRGPDGIVRINGVRYVPLYMLQGKIKTVQAIDRILSQGNSPEARQAARAKDRVISLFGAANLDSPDQPLVTNPECN